MTANPVLRRRLAAWILGLILPLAALAQEEPEAGGLNPSQLITELDYAINNPNTNGPTQLWRDNLDLTFANWRNSGSQNLPVIAAAVALVRTGTATAYPADLELWWSQYLSCQNGSPCTVANPGNLIYFKGQELFAYTYEWSVVSSVMAVNWWARSQGKAALQEAARLYLRKTWSLYGLAAGSAPIRTYQDNTPNGTTILDGNCPACVHSCLNSGGGLKFDGPFLALAAPRSSGSFFCTDNKRVLFAEAIDWQPLTIPNPSWEPTAQRNLRATLKAKWGNPASDPRGESVYALSPADRQLLRDQINSASYTATLLGVVNLNGTRFMSNYRILAWPGGERASLIERNTACARCGGAIYAIRFRSADQKAVLLYPWISGSSSGHRRGLAQLKAATGGAAPLPYRFEAVNCDPAVDGTSVGGQGCPPPVHGLHTIWLDLPTTTPLYHLVLGPNGPGYLQ